MSSMIASFKIGGKISGLLVAALLVSASLSASAAEKAVVRMVSDQGSSKVIQAELQIDAPIEVVWERLTDYAAIKTVLPGYDRSTVVQDNGSSAVVDLGLKASPPFTPAFRYKVMFKEDKTAYTLNLQRISGDFKNIAASYHLSPMDQGTRTKLTYRLTIDLGSDVPSMGASQILKSNTRQLLGALQNHCAGVYRRSLAAKANP